jgi:hypothetical protein
MSSANKFITPSEFTKRVLKAIENSEKKYGLKKNELLIAMIDRFQGEDNAKRKA